MGFDSCRHHYHQDINVDAYYSVGGMMSMMALSLKEPG